MIQKLLYKSVIKYSNSESYQNNSWINQEITALISNKVLHP